MDRTKAAKTAPPLLACLCLLAAPPAHPSGEEGGGGGRGFRRINLDEVLLPHIPEGMDEAFREGLQDPERGYYGFSKDQKGGSGLFQLAPFALASVVTAGSVWAVPWVVNSVGSWAAAGGPVAASIAAFVSGLSPFGLTIALTGSFSAAMITTGYLNPASMRTRPICHEWVPAADTEPRDPGDRHMICKFEDGLLYVLSLTYVFGHSGGERTKGRCLLFLRYDGDEESLGWEVDRCVIDGGFLPQESPYVQDEEGRVRTGGWTGFLDGVQGHLDVVVRGVIDLEAGEAVPE